MKNYKLILFSLLALPLLSRCQKSASDGSTANLPTVSINCTSSNCKAATGLKSVYIYLTTSGCSNINYGLTATATGNVLCGTSGCFSSGSVTWTTEGGSTSGTVEANTYDVCGIIDISSAYPTITSSDSTASQTTQVGTTSSSMSMLSWSNGNTF